MMFGVRNIGGAVSVTSFVFFQKAIETTGTFKYYKVTLVKEGFDPDVVQDCLFILDDKKKAYVPMDQEIYQTIISNQIKL